MDRQQLPARALEPDMPARAAEIRTPSRAQGHEMRGEQEARA